MIIGFTGTRMGMTFHQRKLVGNFLDELEPDEAHHGDCVGADAQFHELCLHRDIPLVIHPPTNPSQRAFCVNAQVLVSKDYIARNHDIVDASDILIATPQQAEEVLRSGTWATIRYARTKTQVLIVYPNNQVGV